MIKEWVVFNKLEDFNSLLEYTDDDITPTGKFCYINENGEKLYRKLRLSPAEPHFPILFPILVQSDCFIFLENRIHVVTPLQKSYC